ncbi:MAG: response regulator [Candidatus Hydrogenedentes bacterium]|nr:response regulator [Candidatus Hydrogenedentota bacterium]
MRTNEPRKGIERKILTSILIVGILPMAVALFIGFISAREGQSSAIEQNLANAAFNKAQGVLLASKSRLRTVTILASDARVLDALGPSPQNAPRATPQAPELDSLQALLRREAHGAIDDGPSVCSVYDPQGILLATSDQSAASTDRTVPNWVGHVHGATFVGVKYDASSQRYMVQAVAPVFAQNGGQPLGYVSELLGINTLLTYALGSGSPTAARRAGVDRYQIAYLEGDKMLVSSLEQKSPSDSPSLITQDADPELRKAIESDPSGGPHSLYIKRYQGMERPASVFAAYQELFPTQGIYIVVHRSAASVFTNIYRGALVALFGSAIGIAVLCLFAYRNVHNNIVRPVSLLNDGAQIIGQGDLELKLKIGTGDEIEELADSFNKMALALKRNIRQLEESEEKYRSLITSMRDGIFQTDPDGVIGFLNPAGVEVFGYTRVQDAIGQNLREVFLEELDYARMSGELDNKGYIERTRVWMKRRDGRAICVELSGNRVVDDYGAAVGTEGIFRDVTKSVRLEQEARERSERISVINQIANVINSSLESGRVYENLVVELKKLVGFDYAALALLNERGDAFVTRRLWPAQELSLGRSYSLDDEKSCEAWVARQRECLVVDDLASPESPFAEQYPPLTRSCLCVPLYASGRIIGTVNLGANAAFSFSKHDIEVLEQMAPHVAVAIRNAQLLENLQQSLEEVTRAREKLHEANEELKTLDEMKTNLLSNVSHELRTPLVAVMGYTDMIYNGKGGPVTDTQKEYLGISLRNIERLVTLIENLLDFSRLHRGAETLVYDTLDLVDCARGSIQIMQPLSDSREIELELITSDETILVEGDKGKLGQVFNNLLSNAVKFNHNGGQVIIELRRGEETVDVTVSDTGIGIPAEAIDKVFTRFYQVDGSSTRKYGGTGIGLSIAQDIVSLHGSRITLTSEVGKGTTFRFALPLTGARPESSGAQSGEPIPKETHLLIEVVTPDRALGAQVRALLGPEGMDVIHAVNPSNAVALALKHSPDCILVDSASGTRGHAILDELLAHPVSGSLPIIVLTNDDELYGCYRSVVAARIKRGFRKSSLLSSIHYALSQGMAIGEPFGDKVLCVDDDPEIRVFIGRCLAGEGYTVDGCGSGEEALSLAASHEYGLILLDIAMPGMDGWETCRRIKSDPSLAGIKVYMVTAKPVDRKSPRAQEVGADGYLVKPFKAEDLLEMVQGLETFRGARET